MHLTLNSTHSTNMNLFEFYTPCCINAKVKVQYHAFHAVPIWCIWVSSRKHCSVLKATSHVFFFNSFWNEDQRVFSLIHDLVKETWAKHIHATHKNEMSKWHEYIIIKDIIIKMMSASFRITTKANPCLRIIFKSKPTAVIKQQFSISSNPPIPPKKHLFEQ